MVYKTKKEEQDMSIFSEIADGICEARDVTAQVAGGLVVGAAVGVVKAPVVVAKEVVDGLEELVDD